MSSKAYEWSLTHELKSPAQYQLLHFLGITADDEGYFSDREGIKGIDFITYVTGQSKSTIMRSLREFEEANLLHRERRYAAEFGVHPTNTIVCTCGIPAPSNPGSAPETSTSCTRPARHVSASPKNHLVAPRVSQ